MDNELLRSIQEAEPFAKGERRQSIQELSGSRAFRCNCVWKKPYLTRMATEAA